MRQLLRRLRALIRRGRLERELADEIAQHLELRRDGLVDAGMDPRDAAAEARRRFGNVSRIREEARTAWGFPALDALAQDARFGTRQLRRSPLFTAVAVLSLANPDSLAILRWVSGTVLPFESLNGYGSQNDTESSSTSFSLAAYEAVRDRASTIAGVAGFADMYRINVAIGGDAELANGHAVSGNYFDVLGVTPAAGRPIVPADDHRAAPRASIRWWP